MKFFKGLICGLPISLALWALIIISILWLSGCSGFQHPAICADNAITAAKIFELRTGKNAYIAVSKDGKHAQAYSFIGKKMVWLSVYPQNFSIIEKDREIKDIGRAYTIDHFIRSHGPWDVYNKKYLTR